MRLQFLHSAFKISGAKASHFVRHSSLFPRNLRSSIFHTVRKQNPICFSGNKKNCLQITPLSLGLLSFPNRLKLRCEADVETSRIGFSLQAQFSSVHQITQEEDMISKAEMEQEDRNDEKRA